MTTSDGAWSQNFTVLSYERVTTETQAQVTDPGRISAGGRMKLSGGTLVNDRSYILAGGELKAELSVAPTNTSDQGQRITSDTGRQSAYCMDWDVWDREVQSQSHSAYASTVDTRSLGTPPMTGHTTLTGTGTRIGNL